MYPDFLCIGAQKAGTTWLYQNLNKHPNVWMPPIKELHYFDEQDYGPLPNLFDRIFDQKPGYNTYWRKSLRYQIRYDIDNFSLQKMAWDLNYFLGHRNDRWYASLFELGQGKVVGEMTPEYSIVSLNMVSHISRIMPHAKIIFIMRNPIERAWSHAVMELARNTKRTIDSIKDEEFIDHFNGLPSRHRNSYSEIIEKWQTYYSKDQLMLAFFDEINSCPVDLFRRVLIFLGLDTSEQYIPKSLTQKVFSGGGGEVPGKFANYLARLYEDEVSKLSDLLGSYPAKWLEEIREQI